MNGLGWPGCLLLLLVFLPSSMAVERGKDEAGLARQRLAYSRYDLCLNETDHELDSTDRITPEVVIVRPSAELILPCFTCLSPEDRIEIEAVWKPSQGLISKRIQKMKDQFREYVLREQPTPPPPPNWKYEWEYAAPGAKKWTALTHNHKKRTILARALKVVSAFFGRNNPHQISVGDRYELVMNNASLREAGFYRCINTYDGMNRVASIYYVEATMTDNTTEAIMREGKTKKGNHTSLPHSPSFLSVNPGPHLKVVNVSSHFASCSKCNPLPLNETAPEDVQTGEKRKSHECFVQRSVPVFNLPEDLAIFRLFDRIPCRSSLLPQPLKKKFLGHVLIEHEVHPCNVTCPTRPQKNRIIKGLDELGVMKVLDYLPVGEYLVSEALPELRRPVKRKSQQFYEADPVVMSCGQFPYEFHFGTRWMTSVDAIGNVTTEKLTTRYGSRILLDERGDLVIRSLDAADEGKYACYNDEGELLASYSIMVQPNDMTAEMTGNAKLAIRFGAFLLIFLLIINHFKK